MKPLNADQMQQLQSLLGHDPSLEGQWSLVPNSGPCVYVINSKGTIVARLSCIDKAGRRQQPRVSFIREYADHYLFCNIDNHDIRLHRLMARVWLPDYDENLTVNHKDGNKHNNDYHNLEMMTVHDNCVYYHTSESVAEQRKKDYAYHGTTIRGRIHITNGIEARMIYESEGIPSGWWRGRPESMKQHTSQSNLGHKAHNQGKRRITDGISVRYIYASDEIPDGWTLGGISMSEDTKQNLRNKMSGRLYVHKGKVNKRIYSDEIAQYLEQGWERGLYTHRDYTKNKQ